MRGFKEDFDAWRTSLTPEERKMMQTQAQGEYNKKFRKSPEFKKDLPDEKIKSFSKILGKFFDAEAADYKKEMEAKIPNYNRLLEKAGDKEMDFKMTRRIEEIDRDADRRYYYACMKHNQWEAKGMKFPESSPMKHTIEVQNDDAESHEVLKKFVAGRKEQIAKMGMEMPAELANLEVPPPGKNISITVPRALFKQAEFVGKWMFENKDDLPKDDEELQGLIADVMMNLTSQYKFANKYIEDHVDFVKEWFKAPPNHEWKTKADVFKAVWAELGAVTGKKVPIDEELVANLEQFKAYEEGEKVHFWGTASKLWKSVAVDAFGVKYLLGVYEDINDARMAFDLWNSEYEKGRAEMKVEMEQWSKQENARLEKNPEGADRIKKILEEARR
jgi:hypothetical protein